MKRNVDLTEDMKFRKIKFVSQLISDFMRPVERRLSNTKPFTKRTNTMMAMGNSSERKMIKACETFGEASDYCDCCGAKIKVPWRRGIAGLCKKCDESHYPKRSVFDV